MRWCTIECLIWAAAVPSTLVAQSALLSAIEGSAPAPIVEPTVASLSVGLPGLWFDPTSAPRATGAVVAAVFVESQPASPEQELVEGESELALEAA